MYGVAYYREMAAHFREIAKDSDQITAAALIGLAEDYEAEARRMESDIEPPMQPAC